jgi:DNA primase
LKDFNYQSIISKIDIEAELELRGVTGSYLKHNLMCQCPYHNGTSPNFGIALYGEKKGLFRCMNINCLEKGTFFHLISFLDDITLSEAFEKFDIDFVPENIKALKKYLRENLLNKKRKTKYIKESILEKKFAPLKTKFKNYLLEKRKVNMGTAKKFGIVCCVKGKWKDRIVIPVRDVNGKLVSLVGRHITNNSRKNKVRKLKNTDRSDVLFGLDLIKNKSHLYVVEGEFDVVYLQQHGVPAVSIGTTSISDKQKKLFTRYCDKITLAFDGDVLQSKLNDIKKPLQDFIVVSVLRLPEDKDPNDLNAAEVKKLFKGNVK